MRQAVVVPLIGLALALGAASAAQWIFFRQTLMAGEERTARAAYHALGRVLERAHQHRDDLAFQEAIQGLSRIPGVLFACVLNNENYALAHTQPAQLGKRYTRPKNSRAVIKTYALQDQTETWGRLVLGVSQRAVRTALMKEGIFLLGLNILGWGCLRVGVKWKQRQTAEHRKQLDIGEYRISELEQELERLRSAGTVRQAEWNAALRQALERIPRPALWLDSHQRLAACNRAACRRLGIMAEDDWQGLRWQDVPVLEGCGETLQRSLDRPGETLMGSGEGLPVEFVSEKPAGGTWIFFN